MILKRSVTYSQSLQGAGPLKQLCSCRNTSSYFSGFLLYFLDIWPKSLKWKGKEILKSFVFLDLCVWWFCLIYNDMYLLSGKLLIVVIEIRESVYIQSGTTPPVSISKWCRPDFTEFRQLLEFELRILGVCFRFQHIRRSSCLHPVPVWRPEQEKRYQGDLYPLHLCHRHQERAVCVRRRHGCHH